MILVHLYFIIPMIAVLILVITFILITIFYDPIANAHTRRSIIKKILAFANTNTVFSCERATNMPYDYKLSMRNNIFYIKLINGDKNKDLYIDSPDDIYFKRTIKENGVRYIKSAKALADYNIESENGRNAVKLIVVCPKALFIYHKINALQSEYVYYDMDLYGLRFISGEDFLNLEELE